MWQRLFKTLGLEDSAAADPEQNARELRLATAALLVHASRVDGTQSPEEQEKIYDLLQTKFELTGGEAAGLAAAGQTRDDDAIDLYGYTRVLTSRLDREGRAHIVEMLWEIVLADGEIDDFEANLVWRVSELLGISTRERVLLRKRVARKLRAER